MKKIVEVLADELAPFFKYSIDEGEFQEAGHAIDDNKVRKAVNDSMAQATANWCDRCIILALHDTSFNASGVPLNAKSVFSACRNEVDLSIALDESPPEPNLRINAADCSPCAFGEVSDDNGNCTPCLIGEVVGNECNQCQSDVILDGATMDFTPVFDATVPTANDNCPDTFWVEVQNPIELWNRGVTDFIATVTANPATEASCGRSWALSKGFPDPATGYYAESTVTSTGHFSGCPVDDPLCLPTCSGVPVRRLTQDEAAASVVRWGTPVVPSGELRFEASKDVPPPK